MSFLVELKRRRVVRVGVVYSATALDRWTWLLGGEPRFEAPRRRGQRSEP
jgi:hypothetical protein